MGFLASLFGGGVMKSVESIATEWIETDKEKAEAKTIMIKALDPNGMMRRQISHDVTRLYTIYILTTLILIIANAMGYGANTTIDSITSLFTPITSLFGIIVTASFGVNSMNIHKEGK